MRLNELDYVLPPELIAQRPLPRRDSSRLLTLGPGRGSVEDHGFSEFSDLLHGKELLVLNNARLIPGRLFGHRAGVHSQAPPKATGLAFPSGNANGLVPRQVDPDD